MVSNAFCKSNKIIPMKMPFFKSGSNFVTKMSKTSVCRVVFWKPDEPVENSVLS